MVQSLIEMVTKLSCEVQALKSDTIALKLQLRDLRQFHTPPPSTTTEALSSTHAAAAAAVSSPEDRNLLQYDVDSIRS
jgi:hypothetical protein